MADSGWRAVAVAFSSLWLLVGPLLVVRWEALLEQLADALQSVRPQGDPEDESLLSRLAHPGRVVPALLVVVPIMLIAPTPWTESNLAESLALTSTPRQLVASLVLILGGVTAGRGLWAGYRSIVIVRVVAQRPADPGRSPLSPGAGPTSSALSTFAFRSAFIFGLGGVFLLPGLRAGTLRSEFPRNTLLVSVMAVIGTTTVLMTVLPALDLASRGRRERDTYLAELSDEIKPLVNGISGDVESTDVNKPLQMLSLLQLRQQVLAHHGSPDSVELLRRLPITVASPAVSTVAAWLALL